MKRLKTGCVQKYEKMATKKRKKKVRINYGEVGAA
jgi:hypothetical protein